MTMDTETALTALDAFTRAARTCVATLPAGAVERLPALSPTV
jgi:hypothetical protein